MTGEVGKPPTDNRLLALVDDLRRCSSESSWLEFKQSYANPEDIGKYISALSNSARLLDKHFAYILWGIRNGDAAVVGTLFDPGVTIQQQPLDFWLARRLNPSVSFTFNIIDHPAGRIVVLEIPAASVSPVEFDHAAYIRIGSATPRLSDYPSRLVALWDRLRPYVWEIGIAAQFQTGESVLGKLDVASYFRLTQRAEPSSEASILAALVDEKLIAQDVGDRWNITNLGAILFAKNLGSFESRIARKGIRFVAYDGHSRADQVTHRYEGQRGYASGFQELVEYIYALLPRNEHIDIAFRTETPLFPSIAIRELVANALIHQDMTITGAGPLIELFKDRMEITNPGVSLIDPNRFIDSAPRSRNEALAALMRRMKICEEQGTGIDKVVTAAELFQLPAPDFRVEDAATKVILYAPRRFASMTPDERVRACFQHAVLKFVSGDRMKNSTLRERFGIKEKNAAQVSVVIKQALKAGLIRPADPERPQSAYVPWWA